MHKVFELVKIFAPTNETILIIGETGRPIKQRCLELRMVKMRDDLPAQHPFASVDNPDSDIFCIHHNTAAGNIDVLLLLTQLNRLVDAGNTVIVVEHDMDVVAAADWVIDIGPAGGDKGGRIIAAGTPHSIATHSSSRTAPYLALCVSTT